MEVNFKVKNEAIAFKGVTDGVYLEIKGSNFDIIKKELNKNEEILKFF